VGFLGLLNEGKGTPYLVLSKAGRERWALPADRPAILRAAMGVHSPSTMGGVAQWHLGRLAAVTPLARLMPGRRSIAQVSLTDALAQLLRVDEPKVAVAESFGGERCVLMVLDSKARVRAYAKVTANPHHTEHLQREHSTLQRLDGVRAALDAPTSLYTGPLGRYWCLVLSPVHGGPGLRPWRLDRRRVDATAELFRPGANQATTRDSIPLEEPRDPSWTTRLHAVHELLDGSVDAPLPTGLVHGDFAPWNVLTNGSRVGIVDWEAADFEGLPFWDLWHFILSATSVAPPSGSVAAVRAALRNQGPLMPALEHYAERVGVPVTSGRSVLVAYLAISGTKLVEEAASGRGDHLQALRWRERLLDEALEVLR
jgi:hypothetical protein